MDRGGADRDAALAKAHMRASRAMAGPLLQLRKMSALIHREEAIGIIAERIIGNDSSAHESVKRILVALAVEEDKPSGPSIGQGIDFLGWPIVREISLVAILHQLHAELGPLGLIDSADLDRQALAILAAANELGLDSNAALLANIGICGLACLQGKQLARLRSGGFSGPEAWSDAERSAYGFDHGMLGSVMLAEADMPSIVCATAANHGTPDAPFWVAEQLAAYFGFDGGARGLCTLSSGEFESIGIPAKKLARIERSVQAAVGLADGYFAIVPITSAAA